MSTVCGRLQGGSEPCGKGIGGSQKREFFVDVINGWPLKKMQQQFECFNIRKAQRLCTMWGISQVWLTDSLSVAYHGQEQRTAKGFLCRLKWHMILQEQTVRGKLLQQL